MFVLFDPVSRTELFYNENSNKYCTIDCKYCYQKIDNIVKFLETTDQFYEGAYLNKIKFLPKSEKIWHSWPLWLINNGYLWEVRNQFNPGDYLLEIGCASGVDYFGSRFKMIGLDLSLSSLTGLHYYQLGIQSDATNLPFPNNSLDGIVSSYFWEHIPGAVKDLMLIEFKRVLKPGGKIVFLYDVDTRNSLINLLKKNQPETYKKLFLDADGHIGYETPNENRKRFFDHRFYVLKHFGMERTYFQSNSVYEKFRHLNGSIGTLGKVAYFLTTSKILHKISILINRVIDVSIGKLFDQNKSRIMISVLKKNK